MKNRKICRYGIVMGLLVLLFLLLPVGKTDVKAGTKYYFSNMNGSKSFGYYGSIHKIKVKNDRIVVYGSFAVYPSMKAWSKSQSSKKLKYKKRTIKFAKNVKFYSAGGDQADQRISKKEFKTTAEAMIGLDLRLQIKNGKIVKAALCS